MIFKGFCLFSGAGHQDIRPLRVRPLVVQRLALLLWNTGQCIINVIL